MVRTRARRIPALLPIPPPPRVSEKRSSRQLGNRGDSPPGRRRLPVIKLLPNRYLVVRRSVHNESLDKLVLSLLLLYPFLTRAPVSLLRTPQRLPRVSEFPRTPYTGSWVSEKTPSRDCLINRNRLCSGVPRGGRTGPRSLLWPSLVP